MTIVEDSEHSNDAPTVEGTGIRVKDIAVAYEHSGYDPDEITQLYPDLSLGDVHRALAYTTITSTSFGLQSPHRHEAVVL